MRQQRVPKDKVPSVTLDRCQSLVNHFGIGELVEHFLWIGDNPLRSSRTSPIFIFVIELWYASKPSLIISSIFKGKYLVTMK